MIRPRHLLIAAALLSAAHQGVSAAEPLERGIDPVPASNAAQPAKRVGMGLGFSNDSFVNGFASWDRVYLPDFDRVTEPNTVYGLPRETLGLSDRNPLSAACCQRSKPLALPPQRANVTAAVPASPTLYVFAIVRKKGWDIDLKDGWKLQAGGRTREYTQTLQTRVGYLSVERFWESFRASYSFQMERSKGLSLAPSQVLQFDYLYGPGESIGVAYADGREFADLGTLGVLNTEVHSVSVRGQRRFKNDWAFTYQATYSDHGNLPGYQVLRLGLQRSF
jgi:YaiO family outer membrane protein